jgi:hypothetical protein
MRLEGGEMRIVLHSAVLAAVNLVSCVIGYLVYLRLRPVDQVMVQVPIAAILSVALFVAWLAAARRYARRSLPMPDVRDGLRTYVLSFVWAGALFVPLHLLFTGYVTGMGNIVALWGLQLPINAVAIVVGMKVVRPGGFGATSVRVSGT